MLERYRPEKHALKSCLILLNAKNGRAGSEHESNVGSVLVKKKKKKKEVSFSFAIFHKYKSPGRKRKEKAMQLQSPYRIILLAMPQAVI